MMLMVKMVAWRTSSLQEVTRLILCNNSLQCAVTKILCFSSEATAVSDFLDALCSASMIKGIYMHVTCKNSFKNLQCSTFLTE